MIQPVALLANLSSICNGDSATMFSRNETAPMEEAGTLNKITWPSGPWEAGSHRSAFQPYKPTTVLTNFQRGNRNIAPKIIQDEAESLSWHEKAGRGNISLRDIHTIGDLNGVDLHGLTGLMWSAAYGHTSTVELLLREGANLHIRGGRSETALHLAAGGGHHDIIKCLILRGAHVNVLDREKNSPVMYAVYGDHPHAVYELLIHGADFLHPFNCYQLAIEKNSNQARIVIETYISTILQRKRLNH